MVRAWPLKLGPKNVWDKERLRRERIEPWKALERAGVGVHVAEWGAFQCTPHQVVLDWMRDNLALWRGSRLGLVAVEFPRLVPASSTAAGRT